MKADTSPQAESMQIAVLKKMGPEKRFRAGLELTRTSLILLKAGIINRHPEYTEEQIQLALIKTILPEHLFKAAYPQADEILI
jgi:hypothetical protein